MPAVERRHAAGMREARSCVRRAPTFGMGGSRGPAASRFPCVNGWPWPTIGVATHTMESEMEAMKRFDLPEASPVSHFQGDTPTEDEVLVPIKGTDGTEHVLIMSAAAAMNLLRALVPVRISLIGRSVHEASPDPDWLVQSNAEPNESKPGWVMISLQTAAYGRMDVTCPVDQARHLSASIQDAVNRTAGDTPSSRRN